MNGNILCDFTHFSFHFRKLTLAIDWSIQLNVRMVELYGSLLVLFMSPSCFEAMRRVYLNGKVKRMVACGDNIDTDQSSTVTDTTSSITTNTTKSDLSVEGTVLSGLRKIQSDMMLLPSTSQRPFCLEAIGKYKHSKLLTKIWLVYIFAQFFHLLLT